jgi:hypothetical protein
VAFVIGLGLRLVKDACLAAASPKIKKFLNKKI